MVQIDAEFISTGIYVHHFTNKSSGQPLLYDLLLMVFIPLTVRFKVSEGIVIISKQKTLG
ncbi:aromatic acid exporter family protein [Neobacillus sp.]|uniref:aromatic acid exporter family protein n=1 Tax=Neobacillus sp. TaxID=2675273 RepID=UPI0037CC4609